MIRNLIILFFILGAVGLYTLYEDRNALWVGADKEDKQEGLYQSAPDFTFQSLKGKTYSLSDFKGKAIVLNFWASWCAPCLIEFPQMLDLAEKTQGKSVFIFMSVDDDRKNIDRFMKKMGKAADGRNIFVAHDAGKDISQKLFQTYKLPETFLINADFQMQEKIIGADIVWNDTSMERKIDLLARRR